MAYVWSVRGAYAAKILEGCLPFFVVKETQAKLGIAFMVLFSAKKENPVSESTLVARDHFWRALMDAKAPQLEALYMERKVEANEHVQ